MLACRDSGIISLLPAAAFLSTFIASIWSISAESQAHDESDVCTSDARSFAEMHSVTPDIALLQKMAVPSPAPVLLEESATTASALPRYKHVPLNQKGYSFLSELKDDREMQGFVRRVVDESGLEIVDEGGLMGMVPYYSGKKSKQSFAALEAELTKVSKKRKAWAVPKGAKKDSQRRSIGLHSMKGTKHRLQLSQLKNEYLPEEEGDVQEASDLYVKDGKKSAAEEGDTEELADEADEEEFEEEMPTEEDEAEEEFIQEAVEGEDMEEEEEEARGSVRSK